ncbi:3408_t:CDS:2 [Racocetra fulgida]|uniref:3408_t:CDS:1 n=1 Tax=Racocetra fulgida TaxID=60492 RepID=A0A9N9H4L2_9GLOM|nr:3408_t:CDS:2 [Racocetra fulgida]
MNENQLDELNMLSLTKSKSTTALKDSCDNTNNIEIVTDSESTVTNYSNVGTVGSVSESEIVKRNQEIHSSTNCKEIVKRDQETQTTSSSNDCREIALEAGMEEFGTSWSKIYDKYGNDYGILRNRSQIQLKDKARNEKLRRKRCGIEIGVFELASGDVDLDE